MNKLFKKILGRLSRGYVLFAAMLLNFLILFVVVNIFVLFFDGSKTAGEIRKSLNRDWEKIYGMEFLKTVYPDQTEDQILSAITTKQNIGIRYMPFIGWITEPGIRINFRSSEMAAASSGSNGNYKDVFANYFVAGVHEKGFRFIGPEQGPWPPEPDALTIFVFGGSAVFGSRLSDYETSSTLIQEVLRREKPGLPVNVYNFGQGGFFSTQERAFLIQLMTDGFIPDIAVFADGPVEFFNWTGEPMLTDYIRSWFLKDKFEEYACPSSYKLEQSTG